MECLDTLKARLEERQRQGKSLYVSLMLDEMSLMSRLEYDGNQFRGQVDLGCSIQANDSDVMATQALVFLVVAINESWKLPISFFFIHGLDGHERANLVQIALSK